MPVTKINLSKTGVIMPRISNNKAVKGLQTLLYAHTANQSSLRILQNDLNHIKGEYKGITSGGDGPGSGAISRTVENEVMSKSTKETKLIKRIDKLNQEINRVNVLVEALDDISRQVIEGYYFKRQTFYDVADDIGYSYRHIQRFHESALNQMISIMSY